VIDLCDHLETLDDATDLAALMEIDNLQPVNMGGE